MCLRIDLYGIDAFREDLPKDPIEILFDENEAIEEGNIGDCAADLYECSKQPKRHPRPLILLRRGKKTEDPRGENYVA